MDTCSLESVALPQERYRRNLDEGALTSLMESISQIGVQIPIIVRPAREDDGEEDGTYYLIAGRHRLEACQRLGLKEIPFRLFAGTSAEARMCEIAENLHRAELTVEERAEHISEWIRLTEDRQVQSAQVEPIESKRSDSRGHRHEGGINAAVRDLGIERNQAQRALKIASISPEAKEAAREAGLEDNQAALLRVAKAPPGEQIEAVKAEVEKKNSPKQPRKRRESPTPAPTAPTQGAPATQSEEWVIAIHLCPGDGIDHQEFYDLIEQTIAEKYPTFSGLLGMRKVATA